MNTLTILVLLIGAIAASPDDIGRIYGGQPAEPGQFPYQVALQWSVIENLFLCGGSIVDKRWIITAAHCAIKYTPSEIIVAAGTVMLSGGDHYLVDKIVMHESYNGTTVFADIALLRTSEDIVFNDVVQPIPLATPGQSIESKAVASGWGGSNGGSPDHLQFLEVNVLSNEDCLEKMKLQTCRYVPCEQMIFPSSLCTLNKRSEGMCSGDSGGPLVANDKLIGIVSWGFACALGAPDVFARVSEFNDWIIRTMADV